jgi:HemY protein
MTRVVFFLIVVGVLALGAAWLADRPGDVIVIWQGMRMKTSPLVMAAALLVAVVVLVVIWSIIRAVVRSPMVLARRRRERRGARAYAAISHGLIAVGSGDIDAARKLSADANRLAPGEPLTLLLSAQTAQLGGDRDGAERAFRAMAGRADTKALGLHGLFIEAHRRDDHESARAHAEEAAATTPTLGWAGRAVLEARCKDGHWASALALLERHRRAMDKASYRRQRAVLLTAQALATEESDREAAKTSALEAVKLAPTLVPAAALAARLLAAGGYLRKANRIIDTAWCANPHPELAQSFAELRASESARDRLKRIDALAKRAPGNVEGALAVARAAIDAREFARARSALAPYLDAPTKRVALLMAALERAEGDEGRAREWLARAVHAAPDPAWTADGYVSDRWLPLSPVTGRLGAFEWRVPLTGMTSAAPVIEPEKVLVIPAKTTTKTAADPVVPEQHDSVPPLPTNGAAAPLHPGLQPAQPKADPVIPLVHAPDDPGPQADIVEETEAEPDAKPSGWRKIFE